MEGGGALGKFLTSPIEWGRTSTIGDDPKGRRGSSEAEDSEKRRRRNGAG